MSSRKIKLEEFDDSTNRLMIEGVRIRPFIWDQKRQQIPGIKNVKQRQYTEVANTLNCSVDLLKKKWANLKRCFYRQVKKIPRSQDHKYLAHPNALITDWSYYRQMLFLIDPNNVHPSVLQGERKQKSKTIKKETTKRRIEETDASTSVPQFTESSNADAVDVKKRRIEETDASTSVPQFTESSSSDTVDVENRRIEETDASTSVPQFTESSSSDAVDVDNRRIEESDASTSVPQFTESSSSDTVDLTIEEDQGMSSQVSSTSNRNYLSTGVSAPAFHIGVVHILTGLRQFVQPLDDHQKVHVCNLIDWFAQNIRDGIGIGNEGSRAN